MNYNNILFIDDDTDDQEIFLAALKTVSDAVAYTVISNPREALQKLKSRELTPDIIFLDLNMPIMTGQQFLIEIKGNTALKNIPVIIFSTSSNPATMHATKELGAIDFITKPTKFDELVELIRSAIG